MKDLFNVFFAEVWMNVDFLVSVVIPVLTNI